ncbi:hypothetical protein BYT27DRAFT_7255600 [Phlegmacium glaucopus]|nr:hypothetical protein BYT27DRAFT_7255600 [Phlegmacium glaucopus]
MEQKATVIWVNALDVLWDEHRDLVEKELKGISPLMSSQEHAVFDAKVEARKRQGNPLNHQRIQAEKYGNEIARKWANERWLDMGMLTVVFTVHTNTQGHTVVDCKDGHSAGGLTTATQPVGTQQVGSQPLDILTMMNGFPMVPPDVKGELMKKQWENLLRSYLSAHYYLASGCLVQQVPFEQVERDTARFVRRPYRPKSLIIKDPRNMHKEDIVQLMWHIYQWQEAEGPFDAVYPEQADESTQRRQVRVNKRSKKGKEIARPTAQDDPSRIPPPDLALAHSTTISTLPTPTPTPTPAPLPTDCRQMSSPDQVAPADAAIPRTPD